MARELVCLVLPDFPLQVMRARAPEHARGWCVLATRREASARLLAVDAELARGGIRAGQSLAQARARLCLITPSRGPLPELTVLIPDEKWIERAMLELLEALHGVAPGIQRDPGWVLYVDLADMRRIEPDATRLAGRLLAAAAARGVEARAGIGPGRFVARLTALGGDSPVVPHTRDGAAFLAPLALAWLPLEAGVAESLDLLGVKTIGDLQKLSERHVADRWGRAGVAAWRLAQGEDVRPFARWAPERRYEVVVELDEERDAGALGFALMAPLEGLLDEARHRGERPESLAVELERSGDVVRLVLGVQGAGALPTAASLVGLLRLEVERWSRKNGSYKNDEAIWDGFRKARLVLGRAPAAAGPLEDLGRTLGGAEARDGNLFERRHEVHEPLGVTLARLRARLGDTAVGRAELRSALRPEATWRQVPLAGEREVAAGGWGTPVAAEGPDPLDLLPLPDGAALRLVPGGPVEIDPPDARWLREGPCALSGEWWEEAFEREYYLLDAPRTGHGATGHGARLVYLDRARGRWFYQGDVD